jgi:hypothetical protein
MKRFLQENPSYLVVGSALVTYVALCTGWREGIPQADAWEHHRAIIALTENIRYPGNPTYATEDPSIRYSPYTVAQALVCRATGWAPYDILSGAAVVNTLLLVVGVRVLLAEFGEAASAATALIVMISLYGGTPAYANSYALADLPWQQVNPSALALALTPYTWVLFRRSPRTRWFGPALAMATALATVTLLDHAMTGLFTLVGLLVIALTLPPAQRPRGLLSLALLVSVAAVLCSVWPWYDFIAAVRSRRDNDYWYDESTLLIMLTAWCWPAYLCGFAALAVRRPLVRTLLFGAIVSLALSLLAFALRSPVLARLPLPALIFVHLPIGVFCHESAILHPATWPQRLRTLWGGEPAKVYPVIVESIVALILGGALIPQLIQVVTTPYLAGPYVAQILGQPPKLVHLKAAGDRLLRGIGAHDVVLSDMITSWPLPSSKGRIVAALHYEFFVPGQALRKANVNAFFAEGASDRDRLAIARKYHVRWIVLNNALLPRPVFDEILVREAIVERVGIFILLDAKTWADHITSRSRVEKAHPQSSLDRGGGGRRRTDDDLAELANEADRDADNHRRSRLHHHVAARTLVIITRLVQERVALDKGHRTRGRNNRCAALNRGAQSRLGRGEGRFRGASLAPRQSSRGQEQKHPQRSCTHGISSFRTRSSPVQEPGPSFIRKDNLQSPARPAFRALRDLRM